MLEEWDPTDSRSAAKPVTKSDGKGSLGGPKVSARPVPGGAVRNRTQQLPAQGPEAESRMRDRVAAEKLETEAWGTSVGTNGLAPSGVSSECVRGSTFSAGACPMLSQRHDPTPNTTGPARPMAGSWP